MSTGEPLRVRAAMKPISTVPRALDTSTSPPASRPAPSTSAATSAPCRRPGWSPRRWSRSCSPTRAREVRRRLGRGDRAQRRAYLATLPAPIAAGADACSRVGPPGSGKTTVAARSRAGLASSSVTPTRTSRLAPGPGRRPVRRAPLPRRARARRRARPARSRPRPARAPGSAPRRARRRCQRRGPGGGLDVLVGVPDRHAEPRREPPADRRLARARAARRAPRRARITVTRQVARGSAAALRAVSSTESPPNFSSTASASTSATIASATTPAAGTAQTSRALVDRRGRLAGRHVDGVERAGHRRDRLHGRAHPQQLTGRSCRPRCRRLAP